MTALLGYPLCLGYYQNRHDSFICFTHANILPKPCALWSVWYGKFFPCLLCRGITLRPKGLRQIGSSGNHYRLALYDPQGNQRDALYFNAPGNLEAKHQWSILSCVWSKTQSLEGVLSWDIVVKEIWPG